MKKLTTAQAKELASEVAVFAHWRIKQWRMRLYIPDNFLFEDLVKEAVVNALAHINRIDKQSKGE